MTATSDVSPSPWNRGDWYGSFISADGTEAGDFKEEDVAEVLAYWDTGGKWDGDTAGLVRLKDGRFVAWEASYDCTGNGFSCDAYGGESDIIFGSTVDAALRGIGEVARSELEKVLYAR